MGEVFQRIADYFAPLDGFQEIDEDNKYIYIFVGNSTFEKYLIRIKVLEEESYITVCCLNLFGNITDNIRNRVYQCCSEMNRNYKYAKFFVDEKSKKIIVSHEMFYAENEPDENIGEKMLNIVGILGGICHDAHWKYTSELFWASVLNRAEIITDVSNYDHWFTDLHMHVIPDVDDGAATMDMSMEILRSCYIQGVRKVFCTPHSGVFYDDTRYAARKNYEELCSRCKAELPDLHLYYGSEVFMHPSEVDQIILMLANGQIPTLGNTNYVLAEFSDGVGMTYEDITNSVKRLIEAGYIPIIAHVERYYHVIPDLAAAKNLHDIGCYFQINAYSIVEDTDLFIRNRTAELLGEQLVDFIGSDAHRTDHRPPKMIKGIDSLYMNYDKEYVDRIVYKNVEQMIFGDEDVYE